MDYPFAIHFGIFLLWVFVFDLIVKNKENYNRKEYIFWYSCGMIFINYELSMSLYRGYKVFF